MFLESEEWQVLLKNKFKDQESGGGSKSSAKDRGDVGASASSSKVSK